MCDFTRLQKCVAGATGHVQLLQLTPPVVSHWSINGSVVSLQFVATVTTSLRNASTCLVVSRF